MIKKLLLAFIRLYQKTFSFDHGPLKKFYPNGYCRFSPSCSEYAHRAIKKHGAFWGSFLASWRILRCNPWSKGGLDPVPEKVIFRHHKNN